MNLVSRRERIRGLEEGVGKLEEEYGTETQASGEDEEGGGFLQNIIDFYGGGEWGDWWRGLFNKEKKKEPSSGYTVYPEWGQENIRELQGIMEE